MAGLRSRGSVQRGVPQSSLRVHLATGASGLWDVEHSGNIQGTYQAPSGNIQVLWGTFREHSGFLLQGMVALRSRG
jgi:hypothetical protein